MPKDKRIVKYGSVYIPEEKPKSSAKRGEVKDGGRMQEMEESIRELQDEIKKSNRDNLDAMYNIDEDNLSSSYRKKIDGRFVEAYSAIRTWADAQEAGFEAVAKWRDDTNTSIAELNAAANKTGASIEAIVKWRGETEDKLNGYVEKTALNAGIKSYIENNKAVIESAVTGKFVKIDTNSNLTTTTQITNSIKQEVSNGIGKIKLSVVNGEKSSTIKLMNDTIQLDAKTIQFTGNVLFASDLGPNGTTAIDGGRITTGMISADRVDVSSLRAREVWYYDGQSYFSVLSCSIDGLNTYTSMGPKDIDNDFAQYLELYGNIRCYEPGVSTARFGIDIYNKNMYFRGSWDIGSEDYGPENVYLTTLKFVAYGGAGVSGLYVNDDGNLIWEDISGDEHLIAYGS